MDLAEQYNEMSFLKRFGDLPRRIFLDTNIVQYIHDFGEFIFENYLEDGKLFSIKNKEIPENSFLYNEIFALRQLLLGIDKSPFHFAVSEYIFEEVEKKKDAHLTSWFMDLWDYWQTVIYESSDKAFVGYGRIKASRLMTDNKIKNAFSNEDLHVFKDAIELECDAILTCDKYRKRQNWIKSNYNIMILYPSDLKKIIMDFQPLWF